MVLVCAWNLPKKNKWTEPIGLIRLERNIKPIGHADEGDIFLGMPLMLPSDSY